MHTSGLLSLANKRILLGVSGSIAAYKSADLVRRLRDLDAEVRVVLTQGGAGFVTALTFQALSGHPVHTDLHDTEAEAAMGHIQLARWADAVLVAPASANFITRLAQGRADDLLSAVCLATTAPVAIAPAMNQQMWANPATQENLQTIRQRGIHQFGPDQGQQACGEIGPGRMLEVEQLLIQLSSLFETGVLSGQCVVVTAGPTWEALDPVRFLSNRSTGKMGFAIARAAAEAGARTILISGPSHLPTPPRIERIDVVSARDMHAAVMAQIPQCNIFIAAAAVSDYRPASVATQKIKKSADSMGLALVPNPDILRDVAALHPRPFTVGFAAETQDVNNNARAKLSAKNLDMIAANRVDETTGFAQDYNAITLITRDRELSLETASKEQLARQLILVISQSLVQRTKITQLSSR